MFKLKFFGRRKDSIYPSEANSETYKIKLSERNYDELAICDVALKFWLPEFIEQKINEMCTFQDTSASDIIRQILFIHLYGRYDLFGLIERQNTTFRLNSISSKLHYCEANSSKDNKPPKIRPEAQVIDKNIADVKVWIPSKMKDDIKSLADQHGKKPSAYVREAIITHLMGNVSIQATLNPPSDEEVNF